MVWANWYAVFSHTGSEIYNIQTSLHIRPTEVWTSNPNYQGPLPAIFCAKEQVIERMRRVPMGSVITLNGYRHLIDAQTIDVLKRRHITLVNIHPAPIFLETYADLRGLDPQRRYYEGYISGKYNLLGVTIHEVDAGIDTGRVLYALTQEPEEHLNYDEFTGLLHEMGTQAWIHILPIILQKKGGIQL